MAQPTISDLHVDRALTDLSVRFTQNTDDYIATKVFPIYRSSFRSDIFWTYDRSYWFRSDATLRAPGAESAGSGWEVGQDNFFAKVYALHKDLDDQTRSNADSQFDLERDAVDFVTQHLEIQREKAWVARYFVPSVWTTNVAGNVDFDVWNDYAASDPIGIVRTAIVTMARTTGKKPNVLVMGPRVWTALQDHPDFLERIKYTQKGVVTEDLLAGLLGIDKVYIAWAINNTAAEGVAASYDFIHGDHAALFYVPDRPGKNTPAAGYTFTWTGLLGTGKNGIRIKRFRLERNASDRIEGETAYDMKLISPDLGYFFQNAYVA